MPFLPKTFHKVHSNERVAYEYEKSPFRSVSLQSLNYEPTERIKALSQPKVRKETLIREGFSRYISDPTYSGVTPAAARARCSSRLTQLSLPFKRHESYQYELPLPRRVSEKAMKYNSTTRINELATPKKLPGT